MTRFALMPEQASSMAGRVDAIFLSLVGIAMFFSVLIAGLLIRFMIVYRRRSVTYVPPRLHVPLWLEVIWSVVPLGITMVAFLWGAQLYAALVEPPADSLETFVVGRQWMWKIQHLEGRREIDELHVPVGRPVKLTMTSEDVIHSFYVPAFRVKMDAVPGRYTSVWFEATKPGTYHIFCAEYCGTLHSGMIGRVVAMEPAEFQAWLSGATDSGTPSVPLSQQGAQLFQSLGCVSCHRAGETQQGPHLEGLFGKTVHLAGGGTVVADERYIRESILDSRATLVEGYQPLMPTYRGLLNEEQVLQLIAYIKGLGTEAGS